MRRVLRKIDAWSVLKVSALFYLTLVLVLLLAGVLLWAAGSSVGVISSVEKFMRSVGFEGFTFVGGQLLRGFVAFGLVLVVLGTGLAVLMAVVYNLISDVVGGIQYIVLEEEPEVAPSAAPVAPTGANGSAGDIFSGSRPAEPAPRMAEPIGPSEQAAPTPVRSTTPADRPAADQAEEPPRSSLTSAPWGTAAPHG